MTRHSLRISLVTFLVGALALSSCVTYDGRTGEALPRGDQRYTFSEVQERTGDLKEGLTKYEVLLRLGSPAEKSEDGDVWIYLPERHGLLIPARAFRVEFSHDRLKEYGYHAIVLGQRL